MKKQQAKVYYQAGNDFLKKREYYKAISSFKQAILFAPEYFKAYCNLGVALKNVGLLKDAESVFEKALKLKPNSAVIYNNLGNVYTSMTKFEQAKFFYQQAIRIYPSYQSAYYNLGQVMYFTGDTDRAVELRIKLEELKQKSTNPNILSKWKRKVSN